MEQEEKEAEKFRSKPSSKINSTPTSFNIIRLRKDVERFIM